MVDNDSRDRSPELAKGAGGRVVFEPRQGYGNAIRAGIAAASGRYVILGDGDGEHDLNALEPFWEKLQSGYDLVVGNRFAGESRAGAQPLLNRYVGAPLLSGIGKLFSGAPVSDFHCGLRGFSVDAVRSLALQSPGMELASEMVVKAIRKDLRIAEAPVTQRRALDPARSSHLRIWRDGWRHLRLLLLLSPRWLFLYPGALLSIAGALLLALPVIYPAEEGGPLGAYAMIFGAAFAVSGAQLIFFSLLADAFYENLDLGEGRWRAIIRREGVSEAVFAVGFLLALLGTAGCVWSLFVWAQSGGPEAEARLRIAIPSVTMFILGMQLMFSVCFMALLVTQGAAREIARNRGG